MPESHPAPERYALPCPGCGRALGVPAASVGRPAHCPHCRAPFDLVARPERTPPVEAVPRRRRVGAGVPRPLLVPTIALLLIGFAGVMVNGYLSALFATRPGADGDYAMNRVREIRSNQAIAALGKPTDDDWEQAPHAAVIGSAFAVAAGAELEIERDERLARAWQPAVAPTTHAALALSLVTLLGAACLARGRGYWPALLGAAAACVNVNHLCCIPGAIFGVWGILALVRDDGRAYFGIVSS